MNPFKVIRFQLYLLQLENYDLGRYFRLIRQTKGQPKSAPRRFLVWTPKLITVSGLAILFLLLLSAGTAWLSHNLVVALLIFLVLAYALSFAFFLLAASACLLLWPIDKTLKSSLIGLARRKLKRCPNLRIIGITGSYGKTTAKEVIAGVLGQKFAVLKTPENINTPLGLAKLIVRDLKPNTEFLVIEMGAYRRGDIKTLCGIAKPDTAVLTGINESHLERFGSLPNTVQTKFEIVQEAKDDGVALLNADSDLVIQNYEAHCGNRKCLFFSAQNHALSAYRIAEQKFFDDGSGWEFKLLEAQKQIGTFRTALLGEYIAGFVIAAVIIGKKFGLSMTDIQSGIASLIPLPHRLEPLKSDGGILVIDDSYNGNPDGAKEAIKVLGRFGSRRKVYITPGLVEMGEQTVAVHRQIGRDLGKTADLVIMIKNSVTPHVAEGLRETGFPPSQIQWFDTAPAAYAALRNFLRKGDVVMFQNDWPDNYR